MAGLTPQGLEIKSLTDVIEDYKTQAVSIFSDQTLPGDVVDVGDNSALGRIIGVVSPALADVWEAVQQVNDSFNPNAATGIALDNIVVLSGINRLAETPTRAQVVLRGDTNISISSPLGKVYSSVQQRSYSIVNPVVMSPQAASGIGVAVITPTAGAVYTISYTTDGINYIDTSVTATSTPTRLSIINQLKVAVDSALGATFNSFIEGERLFLQRDDPFQTVSFTTSINMRIEKVLKPGLVQDDEDGPFPANAFDIDTISVPIIGWDSVTNPVPAITGRLEETDEELRERFRNSKFIISANIIEALIDELRSVAGVRDVQVYENDTDFTNSLGVTPHAFMPIVFGGLPTDIAQAIWENQPTGIASIGNVVVQIADSQGYIHDIGFKRPTEVPVYMTLDISNTGGLPGDAIAQIRQNLVDYGNSTYFIGDDVIYSRFYTPINAVPGHEVNSFKIGTAPSPTGTANIPIAFDAVATFDPAHIIITISP